MSMGPDALRAPAGPLPADPADDAGLPRSSRHSRPRPNGGSPSGRPPVTASSSSSLYEACAWYSTGLGDDHTHDAQTRLLHLRLQRRHLARLPARRPGRVLRRPRVAPRTRRRERHRAGQPGAAPQRGRDRARQRRARRRSRHPHELLRRSARHGGDGRGHAPRARHRRELARTAPLGAAARAACARRQARPRRGRHAE